MVGINCRPYRPIPFWSESSLPLFFLQLTRALSLPFLSSRNRWNDLPKRVSHSSNDFLSMIFVFLILRFDLFQLDLIYSNLILFIPILSCLLQFANFTWYLEAPNLSICVHSCQFLSIFVFPCWFQFILVDSYDSTLVNSCLFLSILAKFHNSCQFLSILVYLCSIPIFLYILSHFVTILHNVKQQVQQKQQKSNFKDRSTSLLAVKNYH